MGPLSSLSGVGVWERGREAGERKTRAVRRGVGGGAPAYGLLFVCFFRQRLTAGAPVCDRLDMCAFNKPGRVAFCAAARLRPEL